MKCPDNECNGKFVIDYSESLRFSQIDYLICKKCGIRDHKRIPQKDNLEVTL